MCIGNKIVYPCECKNTDDDRSLYAGLRPPMTRCCPDDGKSCISKLKNRYGCDLEYFSCRCTFIIPSIIIGISLILFMSAYIISVRDYKSYTDEIDEIDTLKLYKHTNTTFLEEIMSFDDTFEQNNADSRIVQNSIYPKCVHGKGWNSVGYCTSSRNCHKYPICMPCNYVCFTKMCWVATQQTECIAAMNATLPLPVSKTLSPSRCLVTHFDKSTYECTGAITQYTNNSINICKNSCPDFSCKEYNYKCGCDKCLNSTDVVYEIKKYRTIEIVRSEIYMVDDAKFYTGQVERCTRGKINSCSLKIRKIVYNPYVHSMAMSFSKYNSTDLSYPPPYSPIKDVKNLNIAGLFFLILGISSLLVPLYFCTREFRSGTLISVVQKNVPVNINIAYLIIEYMGDFEYIRKHREAWN